LSDAHVKRQSEVTHTLELWQSLFAAHSTQRHLVGSQTWFVGQSRELMQGTNGWQTPPEQSAPETQSVSIRQPTHTLRLVSQS
jgi:hypothetical protein